MHRKQAWAKRVKKERFRKRYLSRMQATRILQVDSMNFRRLCILKGIYPRALGRSKAKAIGTDKQFYLAKEIKWLVRDPVVSKIMAFRAWQKKMTTALAMQREKDVKLLNSEQVKPRYSLIASIKERYPFFRDALRDVDDAMTLISLYAFLSPEVKSQTTIEFHHSLPTGLHEECKKLVEEWHGYVCDGKRLTKAFISIKGYYFEALIKGERIRWMAPHEYAHKFPSGIQQYVLLTFLEFYVELMKFILFKLRKELSRDLADAQQAEDEEDERKGDGAETTAATTGGARSDNFTAEQVGLAEPKLQATAMALESQRRELQRVEKLFAQYTFYISREVPHRPFALVIRAAGGTITDDLKNPALTHLVVDRPTAPVGAPPQAECVQPQYIFDCLNARGMLPAVGYRPGEAPPPHISPFTVCLAPTPEDRAALAETKRAHPTLLSYVPQRAHEMRRVIDPTYTPDEGEKAEGKAPDLEADEEFEGDTAAGLSWGEIRDGGDRAGLTDEEWAVVRREAGRRWTEETVAETVERSRKSAFEVRRQREENAMNQPTHESVARRRQANARERERKALEETREDRTRRNAKETERQKRAATRMQLQVARKKAARYYRMVNSVVQGAERKGRILTEKAKALAAGHTQVDAAGTTLERAQDVRRRAAAEKKGAPPPAKRKAPNPYRNLPKWVR